MMVHENIQWCKKEKVNWNPNKAKSEAETYLQMFNKVKKKLIWGDKLFIANYLLFFNAKYPTFQPPAGNSSSDSWVF